MSPPNSNFGKEARLKQNEAALAQFRFLANDLVLLCGRHAVRVNATPLKLGSHAFTMLVLLAERALTPSGELFATEDVISTLERSRRRLGALGLSWGNPTDLSIFKAVCALRAALTRAGLNPRLVESVRGQGYRLNTPAMNVLVDPAVRISSGPRHPRGIFGANWPD